MKNKLYAIGFLVLGYLVGAWFDGINPLEWTTAFKTLGIWWFVCCVVIFTLKPNK